MDGKMEKGGSRFYWSGGSDIIQAALENKREERL